MNKIRIGIITLALVLCLAPPLLAKPNDWYSNSTTDCEIMPGNPACANYVPVTHEGMCIAMAKSNSLTAYYQAILQMPTRDPRYTIEEVRRYADAGELGALIVWYKISKVYSSIALGDAWRLIWQERVDHVLAGGKIDDSPTFCYIVPFEVEEVEEPDSGTKYTDAEKQARLEEKLADVKSALREAIPDSDEYASLWEEYEGIISELDELGL